MEGTNERTNERKMLVVYQEVDLFCQKLSLSLSLSYDRSLSTTTNNLSKLDWSVFVCCVCRKKLDNKQNTRTVGQVKSHLCQSFQQHLLPNSLETTTNPTLATYQCSNNNNTKQCNITKLRNTKTKNHEHFGRTW